MFVPGAGLDVGTDGPGQKRLMMLDMSAQADRPFVGRSEELSILGSALEEARAGLSPVVVVHGEAGIGKTRTVAEFARLARAEQVEVLWGTVYQGGLRQPYAPWIEALAKSGSGGHSSKARGSYPGAPGGLAAVLGCEETQDEASGWVSDGARLRLFDAVIRELEASDDAQVLVLDDLQWADPDTLELLSYVVRVSLARSLLVLIYRGTTLPIEHPASLALADIRHTRALVEIALGSLDPAQASDLLTDLAGRPLERSLVEAVIREARGNPFFLTEIGQEFKRHGALVGFGTASWRPPTSIRQAVGLRLAGLSTETRNLLELASVFASDFEFEDLAGVAEVAEDVLLDSLDEALRAELLRPMQSGRYDFCQELVRQTLYDQFSPSRRARLHRKVASVIEERHDPTLVDVAAELASHYHESRTVPGASAGVQYALAAAGGWRIANAPLRAAEFLQQAVDLAADEDPVTRASITARLAVAQAEAALFDEALRTLETAMAMLEQCHEPPATIADVVYRTISVLQDGMADQDTLEPGIRRGLAAMGTTRDLAWARLKLLERPRRQVSAGSFEFPRWLGFDPEAVRLARASGDELDFARCLEHLDPWQPDELLATADRIRGWSDSRAQLRGLDVVVQCLCCLHGVTPGTSAVVAQFGALAGRVGGIPARSLGLVYEGALRGTRGDFDSALAAFASAQELAELVPHTGRLRAAVGLLAALTRRHQDPDWSALVVEMDHHTRRPEQVLWFRHALAAFTALALVEAGDPAKARDMLDAVCAAIDHGAPWDYGQNCAICVAGEAAARLGDADVAAELLPSCLSLIEQDVGDYYMTSAELTAARLLGVLGEHEDALRHISAARRRAANQGQRPLGAIINYEEAHMTLERRGNTGPDPLVAVVAHFDRLGMREWVRRAKPPRTPAAVLPDGLTPREADILGRVAAGKTNREIAAELIISVHTVERHIHNAYQKIAVRNRADATAYVIRHGLGQAPSP